MHSNNHLTARVTAAFVFICLVFIMSACASEDTSAAGFFTEEVTVTKEISVERIYDTKDFSFDPTYTLKEGNETYVMELTDVKTEEMIIDGRSVTLRCIKKIPAGTDKGEIPKEISFAYTDEGKEPPKETVVITDELKEGDDPRTLQLIEVKDTGMEWVDDLVVSMRYEDYGSYCYELSPGILMPFSEDAPVIDGYRDTIMDLLDMDPEGYYLSYAHWYGEPFTSSDGKICRNALIYGSRLLPSYEAVYESTVELKTVTGYKATATYSCTVTRTDQKKVRTVLLAGIFLAAVTISLILTKAVSAKKKNNFKTNEIMEDK